MATPARLCPASRRTHPGFPEAPLTVRVHPVTNAWPLPSTATLVAASAVGTADVGAECCAGAGGLQTSRESRRLARCRSTAVAPGLTGTFPANVRPVTYALPLASTATPAGSVEPFVPKNVA